MFCVQFNITVCICCQILFFVQWKEGLSILPHFHIAFGCMHSAINIYKNNVLDFKNNSSFVYLANCLYFVYFKELRMLFFFGGGGLVVCLFLFFVTECLKLSKSKLTKMCLYYYTNVQNMMHVGSK